MYNAASTSNGSRPYQGYPYVNPSTTDVPSISNPKNWSNLPRTQVILPTQKITKHDDSSDDDETIVEIYDNNEKGDHRKEKSEDDNASDTASRNNEMPPVVYIDIGNRNDLYEVPKGRTEEDGEDDHEERPAVNPDFVQNTIYYNPFENRNINDSLLAPPSASGHQSSSAQPPLPLSTLMSKETSIYGGQSSQDDDFTLAPIPVSEFPEPPPAYSEFEVTQPRASRLRPPSRPSRLPRPSQIPPLPSTEPPRTVVITPQSLSNQGLPTVAVDDPSRKLLYCQHCGSRVQTIMFRQVGVFTHFAACLFFFICLFPVSCFIYFTDYFKYKNHYCPVCSKLIGYEVPLLCQKLVYTSTGL